MKRPYTVSGFIEHHYRHFNAASLLDAAKQYKVHMEKGGKMMITLAGAMSTAELGISLSEMIREKKVDIICCTGANLEEDFMNLLAHKSYKRIPNYRELTKKDELDLLHQGLNRVTDTCIPEEEAFRKIQRRIHKLWLKAQNSKERKFPHEFLYELILSNEMESEYEIDPRDSWLYAAANQNLPLVVPGWEDSTLGNIFASYVIKGELGAAVIKSGIEYMVSLAHWYKEHSKLTKQGIGFFQIGGGIAGDFPICVVPMMRQDLQWGNIPSWRYFCQVSDSTTSYGSYSGAVPNEKITWGKLDTDTPSFIIESDATIVTPLIFAYILGW